MDFNPTAFDPGSALVAWLLVFGSCLLITAGATFFAQLASQGMRGPAVWGNELGGTVVDAVSLSPRRIWAIALLTLREAIRRRIFLVGVVFALLFMFAGWFLSGSDLPGEFQVKVYVSFVLRAISWLILPVVLLLACWGIPEDIRLRSLHTVVTKPARRSEVVLGRMLGYGVVGTLALVVMAAVGYVWILRMMPGEAREFLTCRRPVFGELKFKDREGNDAAAGINTGDIWEFRSYIEGATKARAIWTFPNVDETVLDKDGNLQLENRFLGFRSWKGDLGRQLYFQYVFVNPDTGLRVPTPFRTINENRGRTDTIPRALPKVGDSGKSATEGASGGAAYDLLKDVVGKNGNMVVEVLCIDPGQYIGMARPDLFVRTPDLDFSVGYIKAVLCIEMMMLLVVFLGVTASTFAKGPVATLLTFSLIIVGMTARDFMGRLVGDPEAIRKASQYAGQAQASGEGGGVFESMYRIVMHLNPTAPLPEGPATMVMKVVDGGIVGFLWLVHQIIPDFDSFNRAMKFLAEGFDVSLDSAVWPSVALTLAYFIPCLLLGHFALRIRELESK